MKQSYFAPASARAPSIEAETPAGGQRGNRLPRRYHKYPWLFRPDGSTSLTGSNSQTMLNFLRCAGVELSPRWLRPKIANNAMAAHKSGHELSKRI